LGQPPQKYPLLPFVFGYCLWISAQTDINFRGIVPSPEKHFGKREEVQGSHRLTNSEAQLPNKLKKAHVSESSSLEDDSVSISESETGERICPDVLYFKVLSWGRLSL
jgi:hypothetical protein